MGAPRDVRGGGGRRLRLLVMALAALALLVGPYAPARADDDGQLQELLRKKADLERAVQVSRQNAERYRQAAGQFQSAVNTANARIGDLAARKAVAQTQADSLRLDIDIAQEQLALVGFQLTETRSLIESVKAQAAEQTRQLARREEIYAIHLRTTYRQAQVSPLEMLLSSRSLADFGSRVRAMVLINRQDQQLVGEIRAMRASTAKKQEEVVAKEQEIVGLQAQIDTQRASLVRKKADHDALVAKTAAAIDEQDEAREAAAQSRDRFSGAQQQATAETARLNKQLEQTEAAYAALAAELARRSQLGVWGGGKLNLWPVNGPITSFYGPRWGGFHNGLDLAAPLYAPIHAVAAGQVVTAGKPYLAYGDTATVVIIAHGSNFSTLYGHLDDRRGLPVSVGQRVTAGTTIGFVGMTGWTTGPHVHFMTIVDGRAVNPVPYMP